jgi:predicted nucleic acid-binding protein
VLGWSDSFALIETSEPVLLAAMDLAEAHRFSIWDAIVVAAAARAECRLLLSEDMQDGFTWNGVTIANPFSETPHPLLAAMLADADRWNAEK